MVTKVEELINSLPSGALNFITREGKTIQMDPEEMVIPYVLYAQLYRMQEDYAKRGEFITLEGVIRDIFGLGIDTRRTRWTWGDINKETKSVDTSFKKNVAEVLSSKDYSAEEKQALVGQMFMESQQKIQEVRQSRKRS